MYAKIKCLCDNLHSCGVVKQIAFIECVCHLLQQCNVFHRDGQVGLQTERDNGDVINIAGYFSGDINSSVVPNIRHVLECFTREIKKISETNALP